MRLTIREDEMLGSIHAEGFDGGENQGNRAREINGRTLFEGHHPQVRNTRKTCDPIARFYIRACDL